MSAVQNAGPAPVSAQQQAANWKHALKKRIVTWARWAHIYLSMVSFAILLFFAATGLTLNHQDWFAGEQRTMVYKGVMDPAWIGKNVAKLELVEHLRKAHGIKAELGDLRVDDSQIAISFKGPGYSADSVVDRATGAYDVTETRMGLAAAVNDLHKGRDAGHVWGVLIDASAVFMTVVSITGLSLILFLTKRRKPGLLMMGAGAAACCMLYLIFVP